MKNVFYGLLSLIVAVIILPFCIIASIFPKPDGEEESAIKIWLHLVADSIILIFTK